MLTLSQCQEVLHGGQYDKNKGLREWYVDDSFANWPEKTGEVLVIVAVNRPFNNALQYRPDEAIKYARH